MSGFVTELYLNYGCRLYSDGLFANLTRTPSLKTGTSWLWRVLMVQREEYPTVPQPPTIPPPRRYPLCPAPRASNQTYMWKQLLSRSMEEGDFLQMFGLTCGPAVAALTYI